MCLYIHIHVHVYVAIIQLSLSWLRKDRKCLILRCSFQAWRLLCPLLLRGLKIASQKTKYSFALALQPSVDLGKQGTAFPNVSITTREALELLRIPSFKDAGSVEAWKELDNQGNLYLSIKPKYFDVWFGHYVFRLSFPPFDFCSIFAGNLSSLLALDQVLFHLYDQARLKCALAPLDAFAFFLLTLELPVLTAATSALPPWVGLFLE